MPTSKAGPRVGNSMRPATHAMALPVTGPGAAHRLLSALERPPQGHRWPPVRATNYAGDDLAWTARDRPELYPLLPRPPRGPRRALVQITIRVPRQPSSTFMRSHP